LLFLIADSQSDAAETAKRLVLLAQGAHRNRPT